MIENSSISLMVGKFDLTLLSTASICKWFLVRIFALGADEPSAVSLDSETDRSFYTQKNLCRYPT